MSTLLIIDAPAVLHRAWHALPKLTDPRGRVINAVYGFMNLFLKLLKEQKPDYIAIAFDTAAPTFRHKLYKDYKATRTPQPQIFYDQIPVLKNILHSSGILTFEKDGFEADDIIGSLNRGLKSQNSNLKSVIVSGDQDLFQLIDDQTVIYYLPLGLSKLKIYDKSSVRQRFGVNPKNLIDLKALTGDASDNIPGAKSIGLQTAINIIKQFNDIESMYKHIESCRQGEKCFIKETLINILIEHKGEIFFGKKLVTIKDDIKNLTDLNGCSIKKLDQEKLKKSLKNLGFTSLVSRLEKADNHKQSKLF